MPSPSGYPPGVSGLEDQIAGPRHELVLHRACDNEAALYVPVHLVHGLVDGFRDQLRQVKRGEVLDLDAWTIRHITPMKEGAAEFACDWEGDAEVAVWRDGTATWECPRCGNEHEFDYGAEQDDMVREQREERARDRDYE